MMKKWIALVAVLMMLFSATTAFAETVQVREDAQEFDVEITLPQGATMEQIEVGDVSIMEIHLQSTRETPNYSLAVSASEEYVDKDMTDLTEDEKAAVAEAWGQGMVEPTYAFVPSENGEYTMLVMEENTETNDYAILLTIHDGYFISLYTAYEDFKKLNSEDMEIMYDIANSIVIKEVAAAK